MINYTLKPCPHLEIGFRGIRWCSKETDPPEEVDEDSCLICQFGDEE